MSFTSLIRLITLALAMLYSLLHIDYDALAMRLDRGLGITAETGHSWIISAGTLGIYATSIAAILLAFFAVPRGRFGVSALSWVFLLMGISLLTRLVQCWWLRYLGWYIQIPSCISTICFALPALIMFALLRHPVIRRELQRSS